jgi:hypothetical protein
MGPGQDERLTLHAGELDPLSNGTYGLTVGR